MQSCIPAYQQAVRQSADTKHGFALNPVIIIFPQPEDDIKGMIVVALHSLRIVCVLNSFLNCPIALFIFIKMSFWLFDRLFISILHLCFCFYLYVVFRVSLKNGVGCQRPLSH